MRETGRLYSNEPDDRTWSRAFLLTTLGVGALIVLLLMRPWATDNEQNQRGRGDSATSAAPASKSSSGTGTMTTTPAQTRKGIGISKRRFEQVLGEKPFVFNFKLADPVNRETNFLATSRTFRNATIQLMGDSANVAEAALIATLEPDTTWRVIARATSIRFAETVDTAAVEWIMQEFEPIMKRKSVSNRSQEINNRRWTIYYGQRNPNGQFLLRVTRPPQTN